MELQEVLTRLDYTISKAKELKPEQFNYDEYITKFDFKNGCGTICCIAGHYPNWNIEGFYYDKSFFASVEYLGIHYTFSGLCDYHGLHKRIIRFLFYGGSVHHFSFIELNTSKRLWEFTLPDVIERFEHVRNLLASGEITPNQEF